MFDQGQLEGVLGHSNRPPDAHLESSGEQTQPQVRDIAAALLRAEVLENQRRDSDALLVNLFARLKLLSGLALAASVPVNQSWQLRLSVHPAPPSLKVTVICCHHVGFVLSLPGS